MTSNPKRWKHIPGSTRIALAASSNACETAPTVASTSASIFPHAPSPMRRITDSNERFEPSSAKSDRSNPSAFLFTA